MHAPTKAVETATLGSDSAPGPFTKGMPPGVQFDVHHSDASWTTPIFWSPQNPERDRWIGNAARLLATAHGDKKPNDNLVEWAIVLADSYYDDPEERLTPEDAVELDLSYC